MFEVDLNALSFSCQEMKNQQKLLVEYMMELSTKADKLRELSGLSEEARELLKIISDLENNYEKQQQLLKRLDDSLISYHLCELHVSNEYGK